MRRVYAGLAVAGIGISSVVVASAAPASAATEKAAVTSATAQSPCVLIELALDLTSQGGPYLRLLCL
jgi:hypothetical protein